MRDMISRALGLRDATRPGSNHCLEESWTGPDAYVPALLSPPLNGFSTINPSSIDDRCRGRLGARTWGKPFSLSALLRGNFRLERS